MRNRKQVKANSLLLFIVVLIVSIVAVGCGSQTTTQGVQQTGSSKTAPKKMEKWKHGTVALKYDSSFQLMAKERDYFKDHGVDIEYVEFEGDVTMLQALVAGQLDSMEANPAGTITAVQKGANLKIIGSTFPINPFVLYASPNIKTIEELKGKTVGVSKPGSLPEFMLKAMLKGKGMDPNSVTLVNAGADPARYQALVAGKVDATAAASDYVIKAKKDGMTVLGYAADLAPEYPRFVVVANEKSLKDKPDAAVGFLTAQMEGLTYAMNHREEALKLAAKTVKLPENDEAIAAVYDETKGKGYVSPRLEIPMAKIDWLQKFLVQLGQIENTIDLNTLIDASYREKALKLANFQQ